MKNFIKVYYYIFYKFYKIAETAPSRWLSDWKAGICIVAMELLLIASIANYYLYCINRAMSSDDISDGLLIVCVMIVAIPNYFAFLHTDVWKDYANDFDQLPKSNNRVGGWIVFGIALLVVVNFIFSFYLYYQME